MSNTPRIVLITGSATGTGLATAERFARAGDTVVATVRSLDSAEPLREPLAATDATTEILELDVTGEDLEDVIADAIARHGGLDVLINNAGVSVGGALEDLRVDDLRLALDVNFLGTARATRAVLPTMREAGAGRIIAISSVGGARGMSFNDAYVASKFAIEGLYEAVAPVVAMFGVHLTLVEPGPVGTEFLSRPSARMAGPSEPYTDMYEAFDSIRRRAFADCPGPDDIAELLFDLCGRDDPPLRIQDSDFTRKLVAQKLADLDGSNVMRTMALFRSRD